MAGNFNHGKKRILYDGATIGGDYTIGEATRFALFMSKILKEFGIPFAINADTKFFNCEKLKWYESMMPILDAIMR